jgi:hypothetical protein
MKPTFMDNIERLFGLVERMFALWATRGGSIVLLVMIVGSIDVAAFVMYLRHDISAEGLKDICGAGAFAGALLLALKAGSDSTATVTAGGVTASAGTAGNRATETESTATATDGGKQ